MIEGVGRLDKGNAEEVGEVMENVWFTLGIGVCEVVVSGVDTL